MPSATWREWLFDSVGSITDISTLAPGGIYGAGSLKGNPPTERPFIVINSGTEVPELVDGDSPVSTSRVAGVYVHDQPGSYVRIDQILLLVRAELVGQVSTLPSAIACVWIGDSGELADDVYGTLMKEGSFKLVGGGA